MCRDKEPRLVVRCAEGSAFKLAQVDEGFTLDQGPPSQLVVKCATLGGCTAYKKTHQAAGSIPNGYVLQDLKVKVLDESKRVVSFDAGEHLHLTCTATGGEPQCVTVLTPQHTFATVRLLVPRFPSDEDCVPATIEITGRVQCGAKTFALEVRHLHAYSPAQTYTHL
jgi:hypothetical protein